MCIRDRRFWTSVPLERVQKQLEIVNGYVGNLICFAYKHYNSPFVVNPAYHQAYLQYCRTGCLPIMDIPEKVKNADVYKRQVCVTDRFGNVYKVKL